MTELEQMPTWFAARISFSPETGCWIWTAARDGDGYGLTWDREKKRRILCHRFTYIRLVGPIPRGLQLDHLCRVPSCANPKHLEPVTSRENTRRGVNHVADQIRRTHCIRGHELAGANLRIRPSGQRRICRQCEHERWERRRLAQTGK